MGSCPGEELSLWEVVLLGSCPVVGSCHSGDRVVLVRICPIWELS